MTLRPPYPGELQPDVEAHFARILDAIQAVGFSSRMLKTQGNGLSLRASAQLRTRACSRVARLELYASAGLRHRPDGSTVVSMSGGLYLLRGGQGAPASHLMPPWEDETLLGADQARARFVQQLQQWFDPLEAARSLDSALSA